MEYKKGINREQKINSTSNSLLLNHKLANYYNEHQKRHKENIEDILLVKKVSKLDIDHINNTSKDNNSENINDNNNDIVFNSNTSLLISEINFDEDVLTNNKLDFSKLKQILKTLRKETLNNYNIQCYLINKGIISFLVNHLQNAENSEVQLDIICVLNNLTPSYKTFQNQSNHSNQFNRIHDSLMMYLKKENSTLGGKNIILEKLISLIGNMIKQDINILKYYIQNNFLDFLILQLNSTIKSLRTITIWVLNSILEISNKNFTEEENFSLYQRLCENDRLLYYIKFIFNRIDSDKSLEECYEFIWLLENLSKTQFFSR